MYAYLYYNDIFLFDSLGIDNIELYSYLIDHAELNGGNLKNQKFIINTKCVKLQKKL